MLSCHIFAFASCSISLCAFAGFVFWTQHSHSEGLSARRTHKSVEPFARQVLMPALVFLGGIRSKMDQKLLSDTMKRLTICSRPALCTFVESLATSTHRLSGERLASELWSCYSIEHTRALSRRSFDFYALWRMPFLRNPRPHTDLRGMWSQFYGVRQVP